MAWVFALFLLTFIRALLGFIIGMGLLMLIAGFINSVIAVRLWDMEFEASLSKIFSHGLVLFLLLFGVDFVFVVVPSYVFPVILTTVITLIISCFLDGVVCKTVAGWWAEKRYVRRREEYEEAEKPEGEWKLAPW